MSEDRKGEDITIGAKVGGAADRLDEIKHLLELANDRIGPDSSLRWLVKEVDRLRAAEIVAIKEFNTLSTLLDRVVMRMSKALNLSPSPITAHCADIADQLCKEVENLRRDCDALVEQNRRLYDMLHTHFGYSEGHKPHLRQLVELVIHQHRGTGTELAEIHDLVAEALGYQRAPSLKEDPNCPCPGQFITGDHTAQTLVMELVKKYRSLLVESLSE